MIRNARPADLELLLEMAARYSEHDRHEFHEARARAGFAPLLDDDRHGLVWIIEDDEGPAGYAVVTWGWSIESGGPDALLDEIYVERRSRGLGSEALSHIIDECRARGMIRIFLETEERNGRARILYARHGFEVEDSVWMSLTL